MSDEGRIVKHTPGPWHACNNGKCSCKTVMCDDFPIAKVTVGKWGDDYPAIRLVDTSLDQKAEAYMEQITYGEIPDELATANICLIAAAPDLLAALQASIAAGDSHHAHWDAQGTAGANCPACQARSAANEQARTAIAKATGLVADIKPKPYPFSAFKKGV